MSERKFVKPELEGASIPDPQRGRDLPPEGIEVDWSPYWAGLFERGDITVEEREPQNRASVPDTRDPTPAAKQKSKS